MGPSIFVDGEIPEADRHLVLIGGLQWGRRSSSTERLGVVVARLLVSEASTAPSIFVAGEEGVVSYGAVLGEVQWGRRPSSAERRAASLASSLSSWLQWGRRSSSTERVR